MKLKIRRNIYLFNLEMNEDHQQSRFEIGQGVRQGYVLSPHLFNMYSETIMRKALHNFQGGVKITGHQATNLRYVDDVVLIATSMT